MKNIVLLFALVFSAYASASNCTYDLKDRSGFDLETFRSYATYRFEACDEARMECQNELIRRHRRQRNPGAYCAERYYDDGRNNQRKTCRFNLVTRRGRVVDSFQSRGYNPCQDAKRECRQELRYRQNNGRNMNARCEKEGRFEPVPPTRMVSRSCTVDRMGRRGRVVQSHFGSSYGRQGTGVQRQACDQAMRSCRMSTRGNQRCRKNR